MRRLLDASGDVIQVFHYDETENRPVIQTWHDPTAIIEWNKAKKVADDGYNKARDLRHVARLPLGIVYQCLAKYGVEPKTWMQWSKYERMGFYRKILLAPDYKDLRTVERI